MSATFHFFMLAESLPHLLYNMASGPLAQRAERRAFNPGVGGSSPSGPTSKTHRNVGFCWFLSSPLARTRSDSKRVANGVLFFGCHSRGLGVWASCLVEKIGGPIQNEFGFLHPLEPHSNLSKGISRSPTPLDLHHAGKSWLSECGLDRHDNEFLPAAESRDFEHEQAF